MSQAAQDILNGVVNAQGNIPVLTETVNAQAQEDNPTGPMWTSWSETYGCRNLTPLRNFCGFPRRYLLESVRYKECVMEDGVSYPDKVFDNGFPHSRYRQFLSGSGVTSADSTGYGSIDFQSQKPVPGDPRSRIQENYALMHEFESTVLNKPTGVPSQATDCSYNNGVRENCRAPSENRLCDPRFAQYAADNGITPADVLELFLLDNASVLKAIPRTGV